MAANRQNPVRGIRGYEELGRLVSQEIPYLLEEGEDEVGDNVEFIKLDRTEAFPDGKGKVERFGWLAEHAKRPQARTASKPGLPPSDIEAAAMIDTQEAECYRLQLVGLDGAAPTYLNHPDADEPLRITKVIRIPYRWRRPGQKREDARETYVLICYTGPDSHRPIQPPSDKGPEK
jgi:hypothetical protein